MAVLFEINNVAVFDTSPDEIKEKLEDAKHLQRILREQLFLYLNKEYKFDEISDIYYSISNLLKEFEDNAGLIRLLEIADSNPENIKDLRPNYSSLFPEFEAGKH